MQAPPSLRLLIGEKSEMEALQRVLEAAPAYSQAITGSPAGPADAQSTFSMLPPDKTYADKFVFGLFVADAMVGCIDLIRGFPVATTAHIGLLLIEEGMQGKGLGSAAHRLLEKHIQSWNTFRRLRIGVVKANARVLPFWHRLGYAETGEVKPYVYGPVRSDIIVLERDVQAPQPVRGGEPQ